MQICLAKDYFYINKILEKELKNENIIDEKSKLKIEKGIIKIDNKGSQNINENNEEAQVKKIKILQ